MKNRYDYTKKYEKKQKTEEPIQETFTEVEKEEETAPYMKTGKSTVKLNIRNDANTNSDILTTLNEGEEVRIEDEYNSDWYKVCTASGIEGFALKEYIKVD